MCTSRKYKAKSSYHDVIVECKQIDYKLFSQQTAITELDLYHTTSFRFIFKTHHKKRKHRDYFKKNYKEQKIKRLRKHITKKNTEII